MYSRALKWFSSSLTKGFKPSYHHIADDPSRLEDHANMPANQSGWSRFSDMHEWSCNGNLPSNLYEDLEWAISVALGSHDNDLKCNGSLGEVTDFDEIKSPEGENIIKNHQSYKCSDSEVDERKEEFLEETRENEPSCANHREMMRAKLQMLNLTATQMERGEELLEFCTLFPQHYEVERNTLAQLWMASGFGGDDRYKKLVIDSCFDALLSVGCIKLARTSFPTGVKRYTIHVANPTNTAMGKYLRFNESKGMSIAERDIEHLSCWDIDVDQTVFDKIKVFKNLKTLLFLSTNGGGEKTRKDVRIVTLPFHIFSTLMELEVLDLSGLHLTELPSSIGKAKKLKYLDLSFSRIELLPETICNLQNLQTLKLTGCFRLLRLPQGLTKITSLQHLDLNVQGQLSSLPRGMGELTNLETLSGFMVDKEEGRRISELKGMNNLSGVFIISRLERVSTPNEAKEASLSQKFHLEKVELRWSEPRLKRTDEYQVLQFLCPPLSIEHVQISCYGGIKLPDWISNPSFQNLSKVTFVGCGNLKFLPSLGELPSLKILELIGITQVEEMGTEFRGVATIAFPMLEEVMIVDMSKLKTWTQVKQGDFPRLCNVGIENCPNLISIEAVSGIDSVKQLEISQCPKMSTLSRDGLLPPSLETLVVNDCSPVFTTKYKCWDQIKHLKYVWIDDKEVFTASAVVPF